MHQSSILGFFKRGTLSRPEHPSENPRPGRSEHSGPGQPYRPQPNADSRLEYAEHRRGHGGHGRGGGRGRGRGDRGPNRRRNDNLKLVADETKAELPRILGTLPSFDAANSLSYHLERLTALDPLDCPGHVLPSSDTCAAHKGTRVRVVDMDTFDAALHLAPEYKVYTHLGLPDPTNTTPAPTSASASTSDPAISTSSDTDTVEQDAPTTSPKDASQPSPVLVLNLASERSPGGGWSNGALAQEECLCYRSSLSLSLNPSFYPLPSLSCIYTPSVLLVRSSISTGHTLLTPSTLPLNLPVVSVLSIAALRKPHLTSSSSSDGVLKFKHEGQRAETKSKIRLTLRVAALQGHARLVLGALGCGVFANPANEVAQCFLDVFREPEFHGGWWEDVVFAVLDNVKGADGGRNGKGNYGVFWRVLHGEVV